MGQNSLGKSEGKFADTRIIRHSFIFGNFGPRSNASSDAHDSFESAMSPIAAYYSHEK